VEYVIPYAHLNGSEWVQNPIQMVKLGLPTAIQSELIFDLVISRAQFSLLLAHKVINKFFDKGNMYGAIQNCSFL